MKKYLVKNLSCASCAAKIERGLSEIDCVKSVSVNFANASMLIDTSDIEMVKKVIHNLEPEVELIEPDMKNKSVDLNLVRSFFIENSLSLLKIMFTMMLLCVGIIFEKSLHDSRVRFMEYIVYVPAFLTSGWGVLRAAVRNVFKGQVFNEHFLMTVSTIGAFAIDKMPEAVTVMLFYVIGELFQDFAVHRARSSVKALLEIKPEFANLKCGDAFKRVSPELVEVGSSILIKAGEKIPLDGQILEGNSFVDTSVLTGESLPRKVKEHDNVLSGMINQSGLLLVRVTRLFSESSIARILSLVENATSKKAETERFITTFAKYYTPVVVFGSLLIAVVPPLFIPGQSFTNWVYRALIVLVISCPCALVISIPLGYFGGIGAASRRGVLVKGSNFLDALTKVQTVVFDKTGTLTKGEFRVAEIAAKNGFSDNELLKFAAYAESRSNHPIAKSVMEAYHSLFPENAIPQESITEVQEISGKGISASFNQRQIIVGNDKLLHLRNIDHDKCDVEGTVIHIAVDSIYAGYILISDSLKDDAVETIRVLKERKINTVMLTGDNQAAAEIFAKKLGVDSFQFGLLPEDKVAHIEQIMQTSGKGMKVAFVGDGINDAPVIARADIGIAMGALGSDAAIETADVVLMGDSLMQIVTAVDVAAKTRSIVLQNIAFAISIKLFFILLGVFGIATMWEAVFGDMGVAILAILNAARVLTNK